MYHVLTSFEAEEKNGVAIFKNIAHSCSDSFIAMLAFIAMLFNGQRNLA